jgi:hypothetical protein
MRTAVWVTVLIAVSGLLALSQNKLIWGYWIQRPSVASSLSEADEVLGISSLQLGSVAQVFDQAFFVKVRARCDPPSNECLEGKILLALGGREANAGEVRNALLQEIWSKEERERPLPISRDPKFQRSAPVEGLGVHVRKRGEEYVALGYRSSEIANDRFIYSEALYKVSGGNIKRIRQERFFYEVAGLEVIDWRFLWLLNFAGIAVCVAIVVFIKKRRLRRARKAPC